MKTFKTSSKLSPMSLAFVFFFTLSSSISISFASSLTKPQESSFFRFPFRTVENYEGYLKHRRPLAVSLTGALPQDFNWSTYKWEKDFPLQMSNNEIRISLQKEDGGIEKKNANEKPSGIPGMTSIPTTANLGFDEKSNIPPSSNTDNSFSSNITKEYLSKDDLVELFGRGLNGMTDSSKSAIFEVPNSGFAPRPVLKSDANYLKE